MTPVLQKFIAEHASDDLTRLLLSASRFPEIDMAFAVEQIAARRQVREKLPTWFANDALIFPSKIAAEQCSSELTAAYKQQWVEADDHLCDLTGGMGVDSYYFSRKVARVTYIERYPNYCEAARHNFAVLGATNIAICEGDATQAIEDISAVTVFYIDPARRGEGNKRLFALADCEPDLPSLLPSLWEKAAKVITKLSPMADIKQTLLLLSQTTAIDVVSVKNECKELLFILHRDTAETVPVIRCINLGVPNESTFTFTLIEEQAAPQLLAATIRTYLYEPNASILKAGAFKQVAVVFALEKLAVSSHLYTSDQWIADFPGRVFRVEEVIPFSSKVSKTIGKTIPQANIAVRNFPLSVDELRKRTRITDGGSLYLFATTLADGGKVLIKCTKA